MSYYTADNVPIPGTLARAEQVAGELRKIAESFEQVPTEERLKTGTAIDRIARVGQDSQTWNLRD